VQAQQQGSAADSVQAMTIGTTMAALLSSPANYLIRVVTAAAKLWRGNGDEMNGGQGGNGA
jgi:hypothetical protein